MSSRVLIGGVLLAAAVACTDSVTNPSLISVEGSSLRFEGDAPPPPMDSSMATEDGTYRLRVTYFFSKTANNAWLTFDRDQAEGVTVSPNARIAVSQGRAAARGTLSIATSDGIWTADLAKAIPPTFGTCKYTGAILDMEGTVNRGGDSTPMTLRFEFKYAETENKSETEIKSETDTGTGNESCVTSDGR